MIKTLTTFALMLTVLTGCMQSRVDRIDGIKVTPHAPGGPPVPVFQSRTNPPKRSGIPFAVISIAASNELSTETVLRSFSAKGAELGADYVVIYENTNVQTGTLTTYQGFGMWTTQPMNASLMRGVACMYSPVRLGFVTNDDLKIIDIEPGGAMDGTPAKIGDQVLSVGSYRLSVDRLGIDKAKSEARPGTALAIELVDTAQNVKRFSIVPKANE